MNYSLLRLYKCSQTQMRLFPHGVRKEEESVIANLFEDNIAKCGICRHTYELKSSVEGDPFGKGVQDFGSFSKLPDDWGYWEEKEQAPNFIAETEILKDNDIDFSIEKRTIPYSRWDINSFGDNKGLIIGSALKELNNLSDFFENLLTLANDLSKKPIRIEHISLFFNNLFKDIFKNSVSVEIRNIVESETSFVFTIEKKEGYMYDRRVNIEDIVKVEKGGIDITDFFLKEEKSDKGQLSMKIEESLEYITHILDIERSVSKLIKEKIGIAELEYYKNIAFKIFNTIPGIMTDNTLRMIFSFIEDILVGAKTSIGIFDQLKEISDRLLTSKMIAEKKDFSEHTSFTVEDKSVSGFKIKGKTMFVPVCFSCADRIVKKCSDCGIRKFFTQITNINVPEGDKTLCYECLETYSTCSDCGKWFSIDEMEYDDYEDLICKNCYIGEVEFKLPDIKPPELSIGKQNINIDSFKNSIDSLFRKLNTKDEKILIKDLVDKVCNIYKAYGFKEDYIRSYLYSTIENYCSIDTSDQEYLDKKNVIDLGAALIKELNNSEYGILSFRQKFPITKEKDGKELINNLYNGRKIELLNSFSYMPVTYSFETSNKHRHKSFVIVMKPSIQLLNEAEHLFSRFGSKVFQIMSNCGTQHHEGNIAYARLSYTNDDYFVIENLQRDTDYENAKHSSQIIRLKRSSLGQEKIIDDAMRWWDKRTSNWYIQFLDYLIYFAKNNGRGLYMTDFMTQKTKWPNLPLSSKQTYDTAPEELSSAQISKKMKELNNSDLTISDAIEKATNGDWDDNEGILIRRNKADNKIISSESGILTDNAWKLAKKKVILLYKKAHGKVVRSDETV